MFVDGGAEGRVWVVDPEELPAWAEERAAELLRDAGDVLQDLGQFSAGAEQLLDLGA
jgi:hypothetical protein